MAHSAGIGISWFGLILIGFVLFMVVKGLANPHSRPFLLGLLGVGVAAFVFLGLFRVARVSTVDFDQARVAVENQRASVIYSPGPPPGYSSATIPVPPMPGYSSMQSTEAVKPRKAKTSADWAKVAKADNSTKAVKSNAADKSTKPATPPMDDSDDASPQPPQPPAWVKALPKTQGDVYLMTRQTDPYTTSLECEREVPRALQSAVSEYAQLRLGSDQAKNVRLSDNELRQLERDRWIETRAIDVGGETKDMLTVHLLIGFDPAMQQEISTMAENAVVTQRLQGAGVVLGGVLGLLAFVWGGLGVVCRGREANPPQEAKPGKSRKGLTLGVIVALAVAIAAALLSGR